MSEVHTLRIPMFVMDHRLCVQARELLGWNQERLSQETGIRLLTITFYELGARTLRPITRQALAYRFEKEGLVFFPGEPPMFGGNVRGCCPDPHNSADYHLLE